MKYLNVDKSYASEYPSRNQTPFCPNYFALIYRPHILHQLLCDVPMSNWSSIYHYDLWATDRNKVDINAFAVQNLSLA